MGREITIDDNRDEKLQEKEEEIWVRILGYLVGVKICYQ